ncbi:Bifunctional aspartokinase/homoserine dehydrogenase 2 [Gimesia panareensis]|nr:Bifunctional aspartokinase/homoserine dehydrogenase 2 [Gimesia panareensis]
MSTQNVFIIGATGNVGSELFHQIELFDKPELGKHQNPTRIIGIADSQSYFFTEAGIHVANLDSTTLNSHDWMCKRIKGLLMCQGKPFGNSGLEELLHQVRFNGLDGEVIFIDATTGGQELLEFHKAVIKTSANSIVTANKNPVALSTMDDFQTLTADRHRYGMRSTIMAGADTVVDIMDFYDTSDHIESIEGCFSGSLGYICSMLEDGDAVFSQILREALEDGLTEPDPRDDLNGLDVARKLVIIARCLNFPVCIEDVSVNSFIDLEKYESVRSVEEFLEATKQEDEYFANLLTSARNDGKKLRYVGRIKIEEKNIKMSLGLELLDPDSSLATLRGAKNKITIFSAIHRNGYMIEADGAGAEVTANGIRRDLLPMLQHRRCGMYSI